MSNISQEFEEEDEEFRNTNLQQSSNGSSTPTETGFDAVAPTLSSVKKKRNLPGNPDPDAEVIALSPGTLMATNRYVCEVCHKGFQRDQNLQLHRRGHNLPWKLKQRPNTQAKKRVYVCPEPSCVHHGPSRALGDLTGIKKHFCRKHGEKKWKCDKCSKRYAVQSDWKAHSKICGTREYRCDCGTVFSRKDSFVTHRAFCDALAEENYRAKQTGGQELFSSSMPISSSTSSSTSTMMNLTMSNPNRDNATRPLSLNSTGVTLSSNLEPIFNRNSASQYPPAACFGSPGGSSFMSATALLQKAAEMGSKMSDNSINPIVFRGFTGYPSSSIGSFGSVQEDSPIHMENQSAYEKNLQSDVGINLRSGTDGFQFGLFDSSPLMRSESENSANLTRGTRGEVAVMGGGERATVDFLGVGSDHLTGAQLNGVYHFVNQ